MHAPHFANPDPVPNGFPTAVRENVEGWSKLHVQREPNTESLLSAGARELGGAGEDLEKAARAATRTVSDCVKPLSGVSKTSNDIGAPMCLSPTPAASLSRRKSRRLFLRPFLRPF